MANTIQKKIKFSKGQIVPELVERTDMDFYDSSAQEMKNVVSTVYGGVRSRSGTRFVDYITRMNEIQPSTISSDIFQDTSHFTDLTKVSTDAVGVGTVVAKFDYGSSSNQSSFFEIRGAHQKKIFEVFKEPGTYTFNLSKGTYYVDMFGAAGGGGGSGSTSDGGYSFAAAGASGASFTGSIKVKQAGQCTVVVGAGGVGYNAGGSTSFVTPENYSITAGGGGGSIATGNSQGYTQSVEGSAGTLVYVPSDPWEADFVQSRVVQPADGHGDNGQVAWTTGSSSITVGPRNTQLLNRGLTGKIRDPETNLIVANTSDYGNFLAKTRTLSNNSEDWSGQQGFFCISDRNSMSFVISGSDDDITYTRIGTFNLNFSDSFQAYLDKTYRYIKVMLPTNDVLSWEYSGFEFQYMRYTRTLSDVDSVKLKSFVYNNDKKYLLVIGDQFIQIYDGTTLSAVVSAVGLFKAYIKDLKMASKDDTIVFTHPSMRPKILKRINTNGVITWEWGNLDIQNIPYALFGEELRVERTVTIHPSATEGVVTITSYSDIFNEENVGQYIEGNGGRFKIEEYVSPTAVRGHTVIPFYTTDGINPWTYVYGYSKVWENSELKGWPRTCLFAQQRLWFGGSKGKPSTIWASRVGDYFNFKNSGNYDNDAINVDLTTNDVIVNLAYNRGLHVFTTGQEISSPENSLTPNKITFTVNTQNGSLSNIDPISLNGVLCFIEKNGKSLLSYVYNDEQASYTTDNLSMLSNLIDTPRTMDVEVNSSKDKGDFIYIVLEDGTMLCCCVSIGQKIMSISKYETQGQIFGVACVKDDIFLGVIRNGTMCIEKVTDDNVDCYRNFYLDTLTGTVRGLELYNNKEVYVYTDTKNYGRYLVTDNTVVLSGVDRILDESTCHVGFAFDYKITGNPIAINHKTTSIKKRITTADIVCKDTPQLEFCGQKKAGKDNYKFFLCTPYGDDVRYTISGEFYKMHILSVQLNINYEG